MLPPTTTTTATKTVRFGKTTEIEDYCLPPEKTRRALFWKRYVSTWLKEEEIQKKFRHDLKEADNDDAGCQCLRGLEYHREKNASRREYQRLYVQEVVQHSCDLRMMAKLRLDTNVHEDLMEFALELSKQPKEEARKIAKRDAQVALRLHREDTGSVIKTTLRTPNNRNRVVPSRHNSLQVTKGTGGSDRRLMAGRDLNNGRRVGRNNSLPITIRPRVTRMNSNTAMAA